jgi:hypothetical protein
MDEPTALQRYPEAVKVPGEPEIRNLPETPDEFKANATNSERRKMTSKAPLGVPEDAVRYPACG